MLNHIVIMGRLANEPKLRRTAEATPVTSFTVAVERDYSANGQRETDFIDCVAWRSTAEFVKSYFGKGQMIVVSGRLQLRDWTDKNGNKRRNAEIVADNVYFGQPRMTEKERDEYAQQPYPPVEPSGFEEFEEDDGALPF